MLCELLYIAVGVLFYAFLISMDFDRDPVLFAGCVVVWPAWALCLLFAEIAKDFDSPDCEYDNGSEDDAIVLEFYHFKIPDEDNL